MCLYSDGYDFQVDVQASFFTLLRQGIRKSKGRLFDSQRIEKARVFPIFRILYYLINTQMTFQSY